MANSTSSRGGDSNKSRGSLFFLIGNQKYIINEKTKKEKYKLFMMMNNRKKKNKQHSKTRTQETKLREIINSEGEEQSVKPQQRDV